MTQVPTAPTVALPPVWYDAKTPDVSVVILNYNKPDLTIACLGHLWAYTKNRRYEIIVVDNGSTPENVEPLLSTLGPFRLIRLGVNRFFGEGNNIGVQAALGAYVVFLNNDAFVTENWLDPLVRSLEEQPLLGGVGPLFLYPDGRVQEAGAFVDANGNAVQVGKLATYSTNDIDTDHIVDYVSAACFLMRRDLFLTVGGFEYAYEPAYYEDVDLCLKVAARGLFVGYCAGSRVIHIENATSSSNREKLGLENIIEINRAQFLKIWGRHLAAREVTTVSYSLPARIPSRRPRVVFYTPYDIAPGGGERYLLTAATALLSDFDVFLATEETYSRSRISAIGRDLSLDVYGLELVERRNVGGLGPIDMSVLMSNEALPPFPGFAPRNLYICQFPFPQSWSEDLRRFGNLNSFVETIVYSEFVRSNLQIKRSLLGVPTHPVDIIAPPVPHAQRSEPVRLAQPFRILGVGRFFAGGHNKRHDIAIEAVRRLAARGVPVELDLVGSISAHAAHRDHYVKLVALARGLPVKFHPNATPEQLDAIFSRSHLYIHAAGYGVDTTLNAHECEHFGISVVEAMSYGLAPFVVANGGPASFVEDGRTGYTYSSVDELVAKIEIALGAPEELTAVRHAAVKVATQYDERVFTERWRAAAAKLDV